MNEAYILNKDRSKITLPLLIVIVLVIMAGFFLRSYKLSADLPYKDLGPTWVFVTDEGAYPYSAAHKVKYGSWRVEDTYYDGWTIRGYQLWVEQFFKGGGVNLTSARFASVVAFTLALFFFAFALARYTSSSMSVFFTIFAASNFLLLMWSRFASPYAVSLLPMAIIFACFLIAMAKKSYAALITAGVVTFIAFTIKETSIIYPSIVVISIIIGDWLYSGMPLHRAIFNKKVLVYLLAFLIPMALYYIFFLNPNATEWWNSSAKLQKDTVASIANLNNAVAENVAKPNAFYKLFFKYLGARHILALWFLAAIGMVVEGLRYLFAPGYRRSLWSLSSLFMALWFLGMSVGMLVLRLGGGVAEHWNVLFILPVCYFGAVTVASLWEIGKGAFLRRGRTVMVVAVFLTAIVVFSDMNRYYAWATTPLEDEGLNFAASDIAEKIMERREGSTTIVMIDATFTLLREEKINTIFVRNFNLKDLPRIYKRWKPGYIVVPDDGGTLYSVAVMQELAERGFIVKPINETYLGFFDHRDLSMVTYELAYSPADKT